MVVSGVASHLDDAFLLITDKKIASIQEILPILEPVVKAGKKMIIIAEDVEGDALATLLLNRLQGRFNIVCVKAPGFGDRRKEMLQDIAILTGGQVISEEMRSFNSLMFMLSINMIFDIFAF